MTAYPPDPFFIANIFTLAQIHLYTTLYFLDVLHQWDMGSPFLTTNGNRLFSFSLIKYFRLQVPNTIHKIHTEPCTCVCVYRILSLRYCVQHYVHMVYRVSIWTGLHYTWCNQMPWRVMKFEHKYKHGEGYLKNQIKLCFECLVWLFLLLWLCTYLYVDIVKKIQDLNFSNMLMQFKILFY